MHNHEQQGWLLAIDLGTSSVKVLAVSEHGKVIGEASAAYDILRPQQNYAEQDARVWWQQTGVAVRQLLATQPIYKNNLRGIGLSGQMHGVVNLNAHGEPLRNAIIWADGRTAAQVAQLQKRMALSDIIRITGNRPAVGFMGLSQMWLRQHEPDTIAKTAHTLLPKDFINHCLTGGYTSEPSDASATMLFDLRERNWSPQMLDATQIDAGWLPRIVESNSVVGVLTAQAADELGLVQGVPVVAGGGDTHCAALALGALNPSRLSCAVGTSAQLFCPTDTPLVDPRGRLHALCHCVPNRWHVMSAHLSGGHALSWAATLWSELPIEQLLHEAAQAPAGSDGLLFLPYLQGERTPHFDPNARGVFIGLSSLHTRGHLVRAVLEGVAFALREGLQIYRELAAAIPDQRVLLTGGAARSALWGNIIADVLQLPTFNADSTQGSAFGAALLAGAGVGWWDVATHALQPAQQLGTGNHAVQEIYSECFARYSRVYAAVRELF